MKCRVIWEKIPYESRIINQEHKLLPPRPVEIDIKELDLFRFIGHAQQTGSFLWKYFSQGLQAFMGYACLVIYVNPDGKNEQLYAALPMLPNPSDYGSFTPDEFPPFFVPNSSGYLRVGLHFLIPSMLRSALESSDKILNVRYKPRKRHARGRWEITCVPGSSVIDRYTKAEAPRRGAKTPNVFVVEEQVNHMAFVKVKPILDGMEELRITDMGDLTGRFRAWCMKWGEWLVANMNLMPPVSIDMAAVREYVWSEFEPKAREAAYAFYEALFKDGLSFLPAPLFYEKIAEMVRVLNEVHAKKTVILTQRSGDSGTVGWDTPKSQNLCTILAVYAGLRFDAIDLQLCEAYFPREYYVKLHSQPNTVALLFDDVMYSGSQMALAITYLLREGANPELCIPFCLPQSQRLMARYTNPEVAVLVEENNRKWIHSATGGALVRELLDKLCAELAPKRAAIVWEAAKDLYLVIPQFRIPDMYEIKKLSGPPLKKVLVCKSVGHCLDRPYLDWVKTAMMTDYGTREGCPFEMRRKPPAELPPLDGAAAAPAAPKQDGLKMRYLSSEVPENQKEMTRWSVAPGLFASALLQDAGRRFFGREFPFLIVALVVSLELASGEAAKVHVLQWHQELVDSLVFPDSAFEGATAARCHAHWLACSKRPEHVAVDYLPYEQTWRLRFTNGRVVMHPQPEFSRVTTANI